MKQLNKVTRTARGFERIDFIDRNGEACSLQASSIAEHTKPGISAVWLGCEKNCGEDVSPRMHLNRKQVAALITHLQNWLNRDTFKIQ